jgi:hypothetical protein
VDTEKGRAVEMSFEELLSIRSALHQCRDMLISHEKEIDTLVRRTDQWLESNRSMVADLKVAQKEISDLKAIASENRKAIHSLFLGIVTAVVGVYLSKYIK